MQPPAFVPACLPRTSCATPSTPRSLARSLHTSLSLNAAASPAPASTPRPSVAAPALQPAIARGPRPAPAAAAGPTIVLWFRADLRVHDHPALTHALERAGPHGRVQPVYVFDSSAFGRTAFGFEKTGRHRARFLQQAVERLRTALRDAGSDLLIRVGDPVTEVAAVASAVRAEAVVAHTALAPDATAADERLQKQLQTRGIAFETLWAGTLYDVEDLPFKLTELPFVYARFRDAVQRNSVIRAPLPVPESMTPLPNGAPPAGELPTLAQLGLDELPARDPCMTGGSMDPATTGQADGRTIAGRETHDGREAFVGGEDEALRRLALFVSQSKKARVSASSLGGDFACRISPWLAIGCVSPRRIYADLAKRASRAAQTTTYFELVWRDFFRYVTVKFGNRSRSGRGISKHRGVACGRAGGRTISAPLSS